MAATWPSRSCTSPPRPTRSGSRWLVYVIEILWAHTERYRRMTTPEPHGGEHAKMLEALADGRIEAAVEALEARFK